MRDEYRELWAPYLGKRKLNLGCARNHEPGFLNLDQNPAVNPDVIHDLERVPLPFADGSFDTVLASHVFEHVTNFMPLMEDIHRILAPNGHVIAVTPYGTSQVAWNCPFHVRCFDENTWHYLDQRMYTKDDAGNGATEGYRGNFRVVQVNMVPYPEFVGDPEIEFKRRHWNNVIIEVQAVLRKQ